MQRLLVTIGLDEPLVESLRAALDARIVAYPSPPAVHARAGVLRVESARVQGKWLEPDGVLFYSYFDDAREARRTLALAATPTFPDVRATLPLDDRILALVAAVRAEGESPTPRGYLPAGVRVSLADERVIKWGDRHCGEGKERVRGDVCRDVGAIVEPFLAGRSERVLVVGDAVWQLRYESADWRKNVNATVREVAQDAALVARARRTAAALGLDVAGIDYIVGEDGRATLLEVNAYPGFDDVPAAADAFVGSAARWWASL